MKNEPVPLTGPKDFDGGFVVRIRNRGTFRPETTYWKMLLGQYEANGPIPPQDIVSVDPMSGK